MDRTSSFIWPFPRIAFRPVLIAWTSLSYTPEMHLGDEKHTYTLSAQPLFPACCGPSSSLSAVFLR